jgi:uncharacterized membrane protein YfcA
MFTPKTWLFLALGAFLVGFIGAWFALAWRSRGDGRPGWLEAAVGFGTNFFDTLGIGSFATTTAVFRLKRMIDDRVIPGTLNVGHTVPVIVQAFIYTAIVQVDFTTLVALIAAAVAGAWLGAGVVAAWPRRAVQIGMGSALLVASGLMFMTQLQLFPGGGDALGLGGAKLWAGVAGNFVLGALMTLGIGLYAPCMIMISLLGMNPTTAFPIMMGSCAFLMPIGGLKFVQAGSYSLRNALGLTIGGVPGVLIAAYLVTSMPIGAVRWLVIVVVLYAAISMLRAAGRRRAGTVLPADAEAV